jgi:hypothetical protein
MAADRPVAALAAAAVEEAALSRLSSGDRKHHHCQEFAWMIWNFSRRSIHGQKDDGLDGLLVD